MIAIALAGRARELRELQTHHAEELFAVVDANRGHLREWLPWLDHNTKPEHSHAYIESTIEQRNAGQGTVFGVFRNGSLVGICGFHPIEAPGDVATIGYWLARNASGNGLITEGVAVLIDHGFATLGLRRIEIPVATGNLRSQAVCRRLGLRTDPIRTSAENLYGVWVDHIPFFIEATDWNPGTRTS